MDETGSALERLHPATRGWFESAFTAPTRAQARGWRAIGGGAHTLIAAPTGSGKTLAAFLAAIDRLVRERAAAEKPPMGTQIIYVSPLKALATDIARNLQAPLDGVREHAKASGLDLEISAALRTGDTPPNARARMARRPPHILATTPEGLYALVTSQSGRKMLRSAKVVILDEIHALAADRRGAHLALTLERLDALTERPVQRIGLSATQKPIEEIARFLVGAGGGPAETIDEGHARQRDLRIETPSAPLQALTPGEVWEEIYDRVAALAVAHRQTIVFVNARRQCERIAKELAKRLGDDQVASHHGSLSLALRQDAERRLTEGRLTALVATASLELGIDVGDVDLVVQIGSVPRIATFLQRAGRAGRTADAVSKARIFPTTRDELAEIVALLRRVDAGDLDRLEIPDHPLDVLCQQIVATAVAAPTTADDLFALARRAYPYRALARSDFDKLLDTLNSGFATERGRRGQLIAWDKTSGAISARPGAKMLALASGGVIPDSGDYPVRLEPQGVVVGAIAEDFAIHQVPGHVIQLGGASWRVLQVAATEVRVAAAPGEAPYMPVWFGERPSRSAELNAEVSTLRREIAAAETTERAAAALSAEPWIDQAQAEQLARYLRSGAEALGATPSAETIVVERFFDQAGGRQIVVHSPFGARVNRAWALALRHVLASRVGVELQAVAVDDALLLSLPEGAEIAARDVAPLIEASDAEAMVKAAVLDAPMFMIRWRWAASRALAVPRQRNGRRTPPHIQRTDADELLISVMPGARPARLARNDGREGGRLGAAQPRQQPSAEGSAASLEAATRHPLVRQTLADCFFEAMDVRGLTALLRRMEAGAVNVVASERLTPSPLAYVVVTAPPPAFLDSASLMDRRTRNVAPEGPAHLSIEAGAAVHPDAVARVRQELRPDLRTEEDAATHLALAGVVAADEVDADARALLKKLARARRAVAFKAAHGGALYADAAQAARIAAAFAGVAALGPAAPEVDPAEVLAHVLRGRLETTGPQTLADIAAPLGLDEAPVRAALALLEEAGDVMAGAHDPSRPGAATWTDRRVLSRIARLTRNALRAEIEPVTQQSFARFLLGWHGLSGGATREGLDGLIETLDQLDGYEAAIGAWEPEILSARLRRYDIHQLDEACLSGDYGWGRRSLQPAAKGERPAKPASLTRATPIALFRAESAKTWLSLTRGLREEDPPLSPPARAILQHLRSDGASFIGQIERETPLLGAQIEAGLMELIASGLLTADSAAAVRVLTARSSRLRAPKLEVMRRSNSGRWSLLPQATDLSDPVAREKAAMLCARTLLRRYGVVVRKLAHREAIGVTWIELLRVLRRLEARGEVRGGYFVAGCGGEQYALPEALPLLREARRTEPDGLLVRLSGADPLNLTGVLDEEKRVPAKASATILLKDGIAIAAEERGVVKALGSAPPLAPAEMRALRASPAPASLAVYG